MKKVKLKLTALAIFSIILLSNYVPFISNYLNKSDLDPDPYDEGLTTYTITDNGTLNQAACAAISQGDVNITFYAKDLAGNEASEMITVKKVIPSGGLEPGVVIIIVIVSIIGGVAVVAGVYIFMKKRATPATPE